MKKIMGDIQPSIHEKGKNEAFIDGIKEGETFWTVYLGQGSSFDIKTQFEAEVISRLIKIERLLRRKYKGEKK